MSSSRADTPLSATIRQSQLSLPSLFSWRCSRRIRGRSPDGFREASGLVEAPRGDLLVDRVQTEPPIAELRGTALKDRRALRVRNLCADELAPSARLSARQASARNPANGVIGRPEVGRLQCNEAATALSRS